MASNGVGFVKLNGLETVWVLIGSVKFVNLSFLIIVNIIKIRDN